MFKSLSGFFYFFSPTVRIHLVPYNDLRNAVAVDFFDDLLGVFPELEFANITIISHPDSQSLVSDFSNFFLDFSQTVHIGSDYTIYSTMVVVRDWFLKLF